MAEKCAMSKTKRGQANTGPVKKRGPQRASGNPTKKGKIAGNWQDRRK